VVLASSDVIYRMSPDWTEMQELYSHGFLANTEEPSRAWLEPYIHPDDRSQVMEVIAASIQTKGPFRLEHRVRRADGTLGVDAFTRDSAPG
jgi:hypothetical protein